MKRSFNTHTNQPAGDPTSAQSWLSDDAHLNWLRADATKQLAFFRNSLRSDGGFDILGWDGTALSRTPQEIHTTTRMVHSFAIGKAFGAPDCDTVIDAGVEFIWKQHRDGKHGGYGWSVLGPNLANDRKLAYGHVFVLLAASSAHEAGHPDAQRILEDITEVLDLRFIDSSTGLLVEDFDSDWKTLSKYRGFNSNMHGVEAFNAAFEATGDNHYLKLAGNIIDFFCGDVARGNQWRIQNTLTKIGTLTETTRETLCFTR